MRKQPRILAGVALWAIAALCLAIPTNAQSFDNSDAQSVRSSPPDTTQYSRPAVPDDNAPGGRRALGPSPLGPSAIFPSVFVSDVVVNNTDPNLKNTDTFPN